ncbi:hypothetical protein ACLOJK_034383 [Asimina triloba]
MKLDWLNKGAFTNSAEVLEMDSLNMLNANVDVLNRKLDEMNMNAAGHGDSTYDWWVGDYQSAETQKQQQEAFLSEQMKQDEAIQQLTSKLPELNPNELCEAITFRNETQVEDQQDNNGQVLEKKVVDETDAPAENELLDQLEEAEKEELKTYKLPSLIHSEEKAHQGSITTTTETV